jgi:hypothetical protein
MAMGVSEHKSRSDCENYNIIGANYPNKKVLPVMAGLG